MIDKSMKNSDLMILSLNWMELDKPNQSMNFLGLDDPHHVSFPPAFYQFNA